MSKFKKIGVNDRFPDVIETWRRGETVPDWLSDECRVTIDSRGNVQLEGRENSRGGLDIFTSGRNSVNIFVSTKTKDDFVCRDMKTGKVFSLNPTQIYLLYNEI